MTLFQRRVALLVGLVAAAQHWGCGMKGPPLAPFVRVPAAVTDLTVRQLGDEVFVGFTLPTANRDGTAPADLVRVDVYAMTTQPRIPPDRTLDLEEFEEAATLVASLEVSAFPPPIERTEEDPAAAVQVAAPFVQGFPVAISEMLTAETLVPVDPWEDEREDEDEDDEELERPLIVPLMTPLLPGPLQREYVVVGVSSKGEEGEAGTRISVPMVDAPVAPSVFALTYSEVVVNITWEPPRGVRSSVHAPVAVAPTITTPSAAEPTNTAATTAPPVPVRVGAVQTTTGTPSATPVAPTVAPTSAGQTTTGTPSMTPASPGVVSTPAGQTTTSTPVVPAAVAPPVLPSNPIRDWPPATRYDLFEIVESEGGVLTIPVPLNPTSLIDPEYADTRVMEFGVERCYAVSSLDVVGGLDIRSALSTRECVALVDVFPPAAPDGLEAVGGDGAVSLIWEANDEEDLAGYLVLRGVPAGETLQPLTPEPVPENTYRDTTAEPGVRYVYAVRAVDMAQPPNISPSSDRAEDAAR
ncbi:MAG: hypothetical protein CL477_12665 [Acidobacteria bacterium]|nr:hypothetical protein [Acidobacteriota bacterium]HJN43567.1 hypothetical protein [Vicinamibacterales bacterium]